MDKKQGRYERIHQQLKGLLTATDDQIARMATVAAVLHHKMEGFFWTGFYLLRQGNLVVGPYQGPLACQVLDRDRGVCWAGIRGQRTIIVPDVEQFPGHIACDSRSRSEIVIPVRDPSGKVIAVLDVDSKNLDHFDARDASGLEKIVGLI
jgi:GAF domain-containing protein